MADDKLDDAALASDSSRPRRDPPTIDLEATEVTTEPQQSDADASHRPPDEPPPSEPVEAASAAPDAASEPEPAAPAEPVAPPSSPVSPWVIAPLSGAIAAALVIGVGWLLGWPQVQAPPAAPPSAPQVSAATVDALSGRVAAIESRIAKPPAPTADPATATRLDALDKSLASVRADVDSLRTQSDKLSSAINEVKTAPRDVPAPPDLSAIDQRIAQLESRIKDNRAELTQQAAKIATVTSADDKPLRRVVAAALLDVAVRHGDPYATQLAAAKSVAADPETLKPLEPFAASGLPSSNALSRELLNLLPKLSPQVDNASGGSIVDRLQAGASRLVRIERTSGTGTDRSAILARVTAAALRNDASEARRELKTLPDADRDVVKPWLDKIDARDAALAASRKFADEGMADLAKSAP